MSQLAQHESSGEQDLDVVDRRRGRSKTVGIERAAIWAIACAAGLGCVVLLDASPTGIGVVDVIWNALFGVTAVLASSRARRWAWLVSSCVIGLAATSPLWTLLGALAVGIAFVSTLVSRRRIWGALVGGLTALVAGTLEFSGPNGAETALVVIALAPLFVSGYVNTPVRLRATVRRSLLGAAVFVVVVGLISVISVVLAWGPARDASVQAEDGLSAFSDGDAVAASEHLRAAEASFSQASSILGGVWLWPARVVPVLGPQVSAAAVAAQEGASVAGSAAASSASADPETLRYLDGGIDLAAVSAAAPLLAETADAMVGAERSLASIDSNWLVPPLRHDLNAFLERLEEVTPSAELAAEAAGLAPSLLGAERQQRYLVLFTTPAEMRGSGGFIGNWALVTADDGVLEVSDSGRAADVNTAGASEQRRVSAPPEYVRRWGERFEVGRYFQDVTLSPDGPSVALAAAEIFADATGIDVDGVITVDPFGLAALMELTGPIAVEGLDEPLDSTNAADWLLRRQYVDLDQRDERADLLDDVSRQTFDALLAGSLPGPRRLGDVLGPPVAQGRLTFVPVDPGATSLMERLGATGAFDRGVPAEELGTDLFALVTQNAANNKIDTYLERQISYEATVDPVVGTVEARASIVLSNTADTAALPEVVVGSNDRPLALGVNRMFLSFYSPLRLVEMRVDGVVVPVERDTEFGWSTYSRYLEIPAGTEVVLDLVLSGRVGLDGQYSLVLPAQPLVRPDRVNVIVRGERGWQAIAPRGWIAASDGGVSLETELEQTERVEVDFDVTGA